MSRTIITAEDVARMESGTTIEVGDQTTLTASARELARRRGIAVADRGAPDAPLAVTGSAGNGEDQAGEAGLASTPSLGTGAASGSVASIIVTAVGVNRPGVMAELTSALGELGGDIQDVSQRITGGYFNAILVVDIQRAGKNFSVFRDALLALSEPSDYVVTVIDERVFTAMHRLG